MQGLGVLKSWWKSCFIFLLQVPPARSNRHSGSVPASFASRPSEGSAARFPPLDEGEPLQAAQVAASHAQQVRESGYVPNNESKQLYFRFIFLETHILPVLEFTVECNIQYCRCDPVRQSIALQWDNLGCLFFALPALNRWFLQMLLLQFVVTKPQSKHPNSAFINSKALGSFAWIAAAKC